MRPTSCGRMIGHGAFVVLAIVAVAGPSREAEAQEVGVSENPPKAVTAEGDGAAAPPDAAAEAEPSEAERIAALNRVLEADQARRAALEQELATLDGEFEAASAEFGRIDARLTAEHATLEGVQGEERAQREEAVSVLEAERAVARNRFDLVIRRRKAARQQLDTLAEKIALEEEALERFSNPDTTEVEEAANEPTASDRSGADADAPRSGAAALALPPLPGLPIPPAADSDAGVDEAVEDANAADIEPADDRVLEARKEVAARRDELRAARRDLDLIDRGVDVFERDLAALRESLEATSQDAGESAATERLAAQVRESEAQLGRLQARRPEVAERVAVAQEAVASAEERLRFLESPFAPHRVWRWVRAAGPRILVVAAVMALAWWLARLVGRRVVAGLVRRSRRGSQAEREGRAETLRRVFQNAAGLAILAIGVLAALDQAGINVTVLLGGAAVIGAAVAFGAQNLIKDYFTGFMILVENQYSVGNVVRLGGVSGSVEDISLRTTVLRDEEGAVHFVPHSQITTVTNLTHGWSRAVFAIPVGYGEDVDRVMEVLLDLATELRDDPEFGPKTLGDPEMQGVEALGDSAVVVKFLVKTRPLQQWSVKRELLRRIKKRFDRLGIEIPFPHQTVLYREIDDENGRPQALGSGDAIRVADARREADGRG